MGDHGVLSVYGKLRRCSGIPEIYAGWSSFGSLRSRKGGHAQDGFLMVWLIILGTTGVLIVDAVGLSFFQSRAIRKKKTKLRRDASGRSQLKPSHRTEE